MLLSTKIRKLFVGVIVFPLIGIILVSNQLATTLSDLSLEATLEANKNNYIEYRNITKHHFNLPPIKEENNEFNHDKDNEFEQNSHPNTIIRFENIDELPLDYREIAFQLALKRAEARRIQRTKEERLYSNLKDLYPPPPNHTDGISTPSSSLKIQAVPHRSNEQQQQQQQVSNNHTGPEMRNHYVLNLIRVPKAGSSALSVTARALAGCQPDGYPCCTSTDRRVCPREGLMCDVIKGCIDHRPNYDELRNDALVVNNNDNNYNHKHYPSLTMIREPASRLISAFFYKWPHRPGGAFILNWKFFETEYLPKPAYRNVLTKMLNGQFAYSNFSDTLTSTVVAKSHLCQITSFGLSSSPIGLALLLYESGPFRSLQPHPVAFELIANFANNVNHTNSTNSSSIVGNHTTNYTKISLDDGALRVRGDSIRYRMFKDVLFPKNGGMELVQKYNKEDFEVYQFAKRLYCARVREAGLFEATQKLGLLHLYKECFEKLLDTSNSSTTLNKESTTDLCGPFESYVDRSS